MSPTYNAYAVAAGTTGNINYGGVFGEDTHVLSPSTIDLLSLGGYLDAAAAWLDDKLVAAYDVANPGTPLATQTIHASDLGTSAVTQVGQTVFKPLTTPVTVPVGTRIRITISGYSRDKFFYSTDNPETADTRDTGNGAIEFLVGGYTGTSGMPTTGGGNTPAPDSYFGGSYQFRLTPTATVPATGASLSTSASTTPTGTPVNITATTTPIGSVVTGSPLVIAIADSLAPNSPGSITIPVGSSTGTLADTPTAAGLHNLSSTLTGGGLSGVGGTASYTATTPAPSALAIGTITATSGYSTVNVSLSQGLTGGTGQNPAITAYIGTLANFPLLTPAGTFNSPTGPTPTLTLTGLTAATDYYIRVVGSDSGGTVNAEPAGLAGASTGSPLAVFARLMQPPIVYAEIGDSTTYGYAADPGIGTVGPTAAAIAAATGRTVIPVNLGSSGSGTGDWLPGSQRYVSGLAPTGSTLAAAMAANPGAVLYIANSLGINDSAVSGYTNGNLTPAQYKANQKAIADQALADWPTCVYLLHRPTYYTPNADTAYVYSEAGLANMELYTPQQNDLIASYATTSPGKVITGDRAAYALIAENYPTLCVPQSGSNGTYEIHFNHNGNVAVGGLKATPVIGNLLGVATSAPVNSGGSGSSAAPATGVLVTIGAPAGITGQTIELFASLVGGSALTSALAVAISGLTSGSPITLTIQPGQIGAAGSFVVGNAGNLTPTVALSGGNTGMASSFNLPSFAASAPSSGSGGISWDDMSAIEQGLTARQTFRKIVAYAGGYYDEASVPGAVLMKLQDGTEAYRYPATGRTSITAGSGL